MTRRFRIVLAVYSLGVELVVWCALVPMTLARIALGRATRRELLERLASRNGRLRSPLSLNDGARVLVHAVSAGEMNAAEPLLARCASFAPLIVLSTNTHAGMVVAEQLASARPEVAACVFVPWDRRIVKTWLQSVGVTAVVVMEAEIWPNLFTACGELGIPLFIANGRIRDAEVRRYRWAFAFFRRVLGCATWIGVQDARARDAFIAIGAVPDRVEVVGNLKLDVRTKPRALPASAEPSLAGTPLLIAGSTHHPEESWLIECLDELRRGNRMVRLIVAPRDTGRVPAVERLAARRSLNAVRWSTVRQGLGGAAIAWDVLLVDEYGWLTTLYASADVVFLGGTLAPIGGHNIVEAAALGRPVIVGPHVHQIASIVQQLAGAGGIVQVPPASPVASLVTACAALLDDPARAKAIGVAARQVCEQAGGAADRCRDAIAATLNSLTSA